MAKKKAKARAEDMVQIEQGELDKLQREHEFLQALHAQNNEVRKLKEVFDKKSSERLVAKNEYEAAQKELNELIAEGADDQQRLPGMGYETPAPDGYGEDAEATAAGEELDAWQGEKLSVIPGLTPTRIQKLNEAGIETAGQLAELHDDAGVKSVFPSASTATTVADQLLAYLAIHRDPEKTAELAEAGKLQVRLVKKIAGVDDLKKDDIVDCFNFNPDQGAAIRTPKNGQEYLLKPGEFAVA